MVQLPSILVLKVKAQGQICPLSFVTCMCFRILLTVIGLRGCFANGAHISEEKSKTGRTNAQNALQSISESRVTKHLRISLALKEALDTILFICGLKLNLLS